MSKIIVSDLRPAGADLFTDSESFLYELNDEEQMIKGGDFIFTYTFICVLD